MKANATVSKTTAMKAAATKAKSTKMIEVSAAVLPAKSVRHSRSKVDVARPVSPPTPAEPIGTSKQARLISMLKSTSGATLEQMMNLTGWQAHTVRGAISGVLRKRLGLNVVCDASGSKVRRYRIVASVGA